MEKTKKQTLKLILLNCTISQQMMFKQMYCYDNLNIPINEAIDKIEDCRINFILTQVQRAFGKNMNLNGNKNKKPK
jgi:hypothetical protein